MGLAENKTGNIMRQSQKDRVIAKSKGRTVTMSDGSIYTAPTTYNTTMVKLKSKSKPL